MNREQKEIIHTVATTIEFKRPSVPEIKLILNHMVKALEAESDGVVLYDAMVNSDSTEGRGPMKSVGMFTDEQDAFNAIKGKGPMGCSNGDIYRVTLLRTSEEIQELGSGTKREQIYGYGKDWDGKWREFWFDGRDKPDKDPEFSEYQRLKRKFDK